MLTFAINGTGWYAINKVRETNLSHEWYKVTAMWDGYSLRPCWATEPHTFLLFRRPLYRGPSCDYVEKGQPVYRRDPAGDVLIGKAKPLSSEQDSWFLAGYTTVAFKDIEQRKKVMRGKAENKPATAD